MGLGPKTKLERVFKYQGFFSPSLTFFLSSLSLNIEEKVCGIGEKLPKTLNTYQEFRFDPRDT